MNQFSKHLLKIKNALLDLFFPRRCVYCGRANFTGEYDFICKDCEKEIYIIKGGRCLRCSEIIGPNNAPNALFCSKCVDDTPAFNWSMSCCIFNGPVREIVHGLKYKNSPFLVADIIKILRQTPGAEDFLRDSILVPVPLHYMRRIRRGYNQSELIAKSIIKAFPCANIRLLNALKRTRRTGTQTRLTKEERAENIKGAFDVISRKLAKIDKQNHIVIVDDVMTSCATMSECAKVLKRRGFKNVDAFAFARKI